MPYNIYPEGVNPNLNSDKPIDSLRKIVQILGVQPQLYDEEQRTMQKLNAALLASYLPDIIANGITQSALLNISGAQADVLNRLASFSVYEIELQAGAAPYIEQVILPITGYSRGNLIAVLMDLPASTNPTVMVQDQASGAQLLGSGQSGTGSIENHTALFFFNGVNWKLLFWI